MNEQNELTLTLSFTTRNTLILVKKDRNIFDARVRGVAYTTHPNTAPFSAIQARKFYHYITKSKSFQLSFNYIFFVACLSHFPFLSTFCFIQVSIVDLGIICSCERCLLTYLFLSKQYLKIRIVERKVCKSEKSTEGKLCNRFACLYFFDTLQLLLNRISYKVFTFCFLLLSKIPAALFHYTQWQKSVETGGYAVPHLKLRGGGDSKLMHLAFPQCRNCTTCSNSNYNYNIREPRLVHTTNPDSKRSDS